MSNRVKIGLRVLVTHQADRDRGFKGGSTFAPLPPPHVVAGFTVGVLRITWTYDVSAEVNGPGRHLGRRYTATITECPRGNLARGAVHAALLGAVVQAPDGTLSTILAVESHCTAGLYLGAEVGVLLATYADLR